MTTTKPRISEREIAAQRVKHLQSHGLQVRQEVVVTLPDHGQVIADIVAMKAESDGDIYLVCECKVRLDAELEAQAMRWLPYANSVMVAHHSHKQINATYKARADRLARAGIGRSVDDAVIFGNPLVNKYADTRLLSAAFHSHDGSHDAKAGSAAAKRMNGDRDLLCRIADCVGSDYVYFNELPRELKCIAKTAARLRKLIDSNRDWSKLPLDYTGHARAAFYRKD